MSLETHHLVPQSLTTSSSALGTSALGQVHNLDPVGLIVRAVAPFGRNPAEIGFTGLLIEIISASLDWAAKSKSELVQLGMSRFSLSKRRAIALREQVVDRLGARAWSRAGARRRNRS